MLVPSGVVQTTLQTGDFSMSTSLLYQGFGVRGYHYLRTEYVGGEIVFWVDQDRRHWRCSACGSWKVTPKGRNVREFRSVPIGQRPVKIGFAVPRVRCFDCGKIRQVRIAFADSRRTYTRTFERYVLELSRQMTIRDIAKHLRVGWDMIKDIQRRDLKRRFSRPKLRNLRKIAIDEISVAKGQRYLTVVLDLESGRIVFVGENRDAKALDPFWKRLRCSRARIEAVAMDMSAAYALAVTTHLPEAAIVLDRFHVVKLLNDKLTQLRRQVYRVSTDVLQKEVLKGTRWLLLKNPENLDPTRNEQQRLEEALELNRPLATAYYLKEDLRQIWSQPDKTTAEAVLRDWIARAESSGILVLQRLARTLAIHRERILAWYDYRISTGPLEGINNKIKTLKRQAYGFRDQEFFKLKILAIHESRYALVG